MALPSFREKRLFKRIRVEIGVDVCIRSFGSKHPYYLRTTNVSSGGAFVATEGKQKLPFSLQSILEISLYLNKERTESIEFVAKIAHLNKDHGFGLKITQISDEDQQKLNAFVDGVIQNSPELVIR
jgi:hypothetical protein